MAACFQVVLLSCGACLHLLYLSSIFYIYFKSPILPGLNSVDTLSKPLAKRLVLFVTDGLRADKLFHRNNVNITHYLRQIIKNEGRWGVSHTRVPTESRVGHVSMMAGTYEDVSAITNGWKDNPVNFDSLFNQSYNTWSWGSPDILNIFKKQSNNNFHPFSYDSKEIDFASSDPSLLDKWVFEHIQKFLSDSKQSKDMNRELRQTKTVFFLHLLGIDTNGHAKKPDSKEYHENIDIVDKGIQKAVSQFEDFFDHDGKTVYVVTSDHGMTSWGAHGTGLQSETETPYLLWGSGIKKPNKRRNINKDSQTMVWGLEDFERVDLQQIDLASLMSFLIGTSFPVNSVGRLPYRVLDTDMKEKALGLIHNVKQIKLQYDAHERKAKDSSLFFTPFTGVNEDLTSMLEDSIEKHQDDDAALQIVLNKANAWIDILLAGIDYYHRYHRLWLSLCVNCAFIIWLFLLVTTLMYENTGIVTKKQIHRNLKIVTVLKSRLFQLIAVSAGVSVAFMLYVKSKELSFVLYTVLPVIMALIALNRIDMINDVWFSVTQKVANVGNVLQFTGITVFSVASLELLIHAFFDRRSLTVAAVFFAFVPWIKLVFANNNRAFTVLQNLIGVLFTFTSLALGYFPQMPVIHKEENYMLVVLGSFLFSAFGMIYTFFVKDRNSLIIASQTALVISCTVVKLHSVGSIDEGNGLPWFNQLFSWSVVLMAPILVALTEKDSVSRLVSTILALASIYVLTSISYETMFLLVLVLHLLSWVAMEIYLFSPCKTTPKFTSKDNNSTHLSLDHLRIAFMFVYYIFISFFGTGNVASINSFDIASTYCFQTVFNPWVQGMVLAIKVLVPFLMVTLVFRSMDATTVLPMKALFLIILLLTDIMSMHFFFWVKDEGSWLDIGQSLSHFLINLTFVIFLIPVYKLSYYVTGSVSLKVLKPHTM